MRPKAVARLAPFAGLLAAVTLTTVVTAAPPTRLSNGTVTPTSGTTATLFQFSVRFQSGSETATSVSVTVAGTQHPLVRTGGTTANETWTGSFTLPAGSWSVTFRSVSSGGTNPTFVMPGQVVVTAPTPPPTPRATPPPRSTPVPATATPKPGSSVSPAVSPTPFGTTLTDPSNRPSGSASASSPNEPAASPSPFGAPGNNQGSRPFNVPLEGVVAIGLLGAVTVAAALGERRRRQAAEAFRVAEASAGGAPPAQAEDLEKGWEHDLADEETVATIDYDAPEETREAPDEPVDDSRDSAG
jgi:hypothetical protein